MCKRKREGKYFTDDDLPATKKLFDDRKENERLKQLRKCWEEADEDSRWAALRECWKKDKEEPAMPRHIDDPEEEDGPGIFKVSQNKNNGYDTCKEFVVIARSEGGARATHPNG
eukprot:2368398-Prymnesium_polylepis.1